MARNLSYSFTFLATFLLTQAGCILDAKVSDLGSAVSSITYENGDYSNNSSPVIVGTVKPNSEVFLFTRNSCEGASVASVIADSSGKFSIAYPLSLTSNGTYQFSIRVKDNKGNLSCANVPDYTYDSDSPSVAIEQMNTQPDPTSVFPIRFLVTFSKAIRASSFTTGKVTNAGNAAGVQWSIENSGDDKTFFLNATSASTQGTIKPKIVSGVIADAAGNLNSGSTSVDARVSYGLVILPKHEDNGADWNDYVATSLTGAIYKSTDAACIGTESTYRDCVHAGEIRNVVIPETVSCAGLSMTDSLGVFDWVCGINSKGQAAFTSTGFKYGKGLRDLIKADGSGWKDNQVTLTGGAGGTSTAINWWPNNPVALLPDNSATSVQETLDSPKTVYVVPTSRTGFSYYVDADKISVVTLPGVTLTYNNSSNYSCNSSNWTIYTPNARCLFINSTGRKNLWFEIDTVASGATLSTSPLTLVGATNSRVRNSKLNYGTVRVMGSNNSVFEYSEYITSVTFDNSNGNLMREAVINRGYLSVIASSRNSFNQMGISGGSYGIDMNGVSTDNSFTGFTISNTSNSAIQVSGASITRSVFAHGSAVNIASVGYGQWSGKRTTLHSLMTINVKEHGINLAAPATEFSFSNIVSAHNLYNAITHPSGSYNKFSGVWKSGNNTNTTCNVSGTSPGINSACAGTDLSTGLLTSITGASVTLASSFKGKVTDSVNTFGATGTTTYPTNAIAFDWVNFLNPFSATSPFNIYRAWGIYNAAAFPNAVFRARWASGTGQIWDFALSAADTVVLNRSDNGSTANAAITNGVACPSWLSGNATVKDLAYGEATSGSGGDNDGICEVGEVCLGRVFVRNAMEIAGDGIGNDNGLCETGEACIAAPNFGSYLGHGDYKSTSCLFQDGTVSGVKMYYYPNNGL